MPLRTTAFPIAFAAALLTPRAETGLHPQSLGFGLGWVFDQDTVFCPVNQGSFHGMLQVNPSSKAWKWLNAADYPANVNGKMAMKSRDEGVILNLSGNAPWYTTDGWKTVAQAKGTATDGIDQVVLTEAGYAGHGKLNKGIMFSADGKTWEAADPASAGSGAGTLAAFKNKAVIFSPGSFELVSTDGGKKYDIVMYDNPPFGKINSVLSFRMFSADSFLVLTDEAIYASADGGVKWTAAKTMPASSQWAIVRGPLDYIVADRDGNLHLTADGGAHWTDRKGPGDGQSYGAPALIGDALWFWPGQVSKDDGASWTPMFPGWLNASGIGAPYSIAFRGDFGAVGFGAGKIAYTWDKGRSFTVLDTLPSKQDVMALKFLKSGRILAGDRNGQVFITADTGKTWTQKLQSAFSQNAVKFSVSDDEKVMVLTRLGQPAGSGDNGDKWDFLPNAGGTLVQTVKPDGTIIGMANMEYATLDLSKPRTKIDTLPSDQGPEDIVAVDDKIGYLATRVSGIGDQENRIYKTTDGFKTFSLAATLPKGAFTPARLQAVNSDFLVLSAEGKAFAYVSADGGKTWTRDSVDATSRYTQFNGLRRVWWFNPGERIYALNGAALYLNTGVPGSTGIRDAARRQARAAFAADYDALTGRILVRGMDAADIGVFDLSGRRMPAAPLKGGNGVEAASLPKGLYFVQARARTGEVRAARLLVR